RRQQRACRQSLRAHAFEYEQHSGRRHIAIVGEHLPFVVERTLMERKRSLQRGYDPGAAGMADEPADVRHRELHACENLHHGGVEMRGDEIGDGTAEGHAESFRVDIPTHDAERIGPKCSPEISIPVAPPSPARNMIAAAPSPNRLTATMLALVSSSSRSASEQSSIATSSTLVPGRAWARRDAIDKPETPPAQPRPNTGTRVTSDRNPITRATRASRLGVAIPVEQTVTTVSISPPPSCAFAS